MRKNFPITELCEALGVSRSGYHNLGKREPSKRRRANEQLLHQIRIIHSDRHTRCYGSPRMTRELRALGIGCSENRVARIMRSKDLRARPRRPFRPKTTQPDHAAHPSPNLRDPSSSDHISERDEADGLGLLAQRGTSYATVNQFPAQNVPTAMHPHGGQT